MDLDLSKVCRVSQRSKNPRKLDQLIQVNYSFNAIFKTDVELISFQGLYSNNVFEHGLF